MIKFCNLHGHSSYSLFDGLGTVEDYVEWELKNNPDQDFHSFAITDHGSCSAAGEIASCQEKYKKKNIPLKLIYGIEAYYIPSLKDWFVLKQQADEKRKEEKANKKKNKEQNDDEDSSDLVIEDEKDKRSKRTYDPLSRRNHLVVLATNQKGLTNLFKLVSRSYRYGFYKKPRIDLEMLCELNEGLAISTACIAGIPSWCSNHPDVLLGKKNWIDLYNEELLPLMNVYGKDRFFLELQFNKLEQQKVVNKHLIEYSKITGFDLVCCADAHFANKDLWLSREIHKLLGYQLQKQNVDLSTLPQKIEDLDCELYLKNGDQMFESYKRYMPDDTNEQIVREAIERTYDIAKNKIEYIVPDKTTKLPQTIKPNEQFKTPYDKLKHLIICGLKEKNLNKKEYIERAVYELEIIHKLGVEEYFLALKEMLDVLKKKMLLGCGRGSGAGSIVNYLLNITLVNPIKNGLLFERFLSPSRAELPDIDSDLELKEECLDILKEHFGENNVLAISNYNRLKLKSLIKDLSNLYGVDFQVVNEVTKVIEKEARGAIMEEIGHDQKLYELTFEKAKEHSPTFNKFLKEYPDVGTHVENLFKEIKSIGAHAGGCLVVPNAEEHIPIIRIRQRDQCPVSEGLTSQHLKYFGLVKFDLLGLTTLKIIRRCIEEILKTQGNNRPTINDVWNFYNSNLHPDIIDPCDEKVFENVYHKGKFPSIFQFTERGVQQFCVKAKPNSVEDISAITSLWRPGPLTAEADKRYLAFRDTDLLKEHPILQEVLGYTKNLILYQESFMALANKLAGFSLEEADKLRKLLVKPATSLAEEMKKERLEYREKFIKGCIDKGMTQQRAEVLWDKEILGFISYGFNRSHSISYAYNSYHCAWLYTYYPKQWLKACLELDPDLTKTINVVRSLGFNVLKPDVNTSVVEEWVVDDNNNCIPPLVSLKGIGLTAANELVDRRPKEGFKNIQDFLFDHEGNYRWNKLNKKAISILLKIEAFSSMEDVGPDKLFKNHKHIETTLFEEENTLKNIKSGKETIEQLAFLSPQDDWTTTEKIVIQKEIAGFYNKGLIVGKFLDVFEQFNITAIDETEDEEDKYKIWCLIESINKKTTKTGKPFLNVSVSGLTEKMYFFRVWDNQMKRNDSNVFKEGNIVVISLSYNADFGYNLSDSMKVMLVNK